MQHSSSNAYEWSNLTRKSRKSAIFGIVSGVFEDMPSWLSVGMPTTAVFRRFRIEALKAGADEVPYLVGGAGPGGYGDIISPPTDRLLAPEDVLMLDTGSVFDGYFSDFDRNYGIGTASDESRRAYELVFAATEAGLAMARPDATCSDLFCAMNRVLEEGGALGSDVGRFWPRPRHAADGVAVEHHLGRNRACARNGHHIGARNDLCAREDDGARGKPRDS